MDLNEVSVFIKVVELGSFSQAARYLGMPNSTVSAKISDLEKYLGVSLIKRTTRRLFITPEGRTFFESCRLGLDQIKKATDVIMGTKGEPHGKLRLTAPVGLGSAIIPKIISLFKERYPQVQVDISLSDRTVDIISEGFDIAIRVGELKDSSLIAKKLGDVYFAPFASAKYLKIHGTPRTPQDLVNHCCLQFTNLGSEEWKLNSLKKTIKIPMRKKIMVNELTVLKILALDGEGVSLLPTFLCFNEVQNGKLVRILPDWKSNTMPVSFVYAAQKYIPSKISAFIQLATEPIKQSLQNYEF